MKVLTKARFIRSTLKALESKASDFKDAGTTNGNAINKVVKDVENAAYDSGLFETGEISAHTTDRFGNPYKLQDMLNWRAIFLNYLK